MAAAAKTTMKMIVRRDPDPVRHAQLGVDARGAIDLAVGLPDLLDALSQPGVVERPLTRRTGLPVIEARA